MITSFARVFAEKCLPLGRVEFGHCLGDSNHIFGWETPQQPGLILSEDALVHGILNRLRHLEQVEIVHHRTLRMQAEMATSLRLRHLEVHDGELHRTGFIDG